jgi:hypothetical protein
MISKYMRYTTPVVLSLLLASGCTKGSDDNSLAQDTAALNSDLALANKDTGLSTALADTGTIRQSAGGNAAVSTSRPRTTTRPSTTSRTSTRPSGTATSGSAGAATATVAPTTGTIPAGSSLSLRSNTKVCTNTSHVGDRFTATVNESVAGASGAVIPAGATVTLEATQLKRSENVNDKVVMSFRVVSMTFGGHTYTPDASVTYADITKVKNQPKSKDVQKVAGGAAIGAVVGKILGKDTKGAVIGGAAGAAAGAAAAVATANYEGCVNQGSTLTVMLNSGQEVYF